MLAKLLVVIALVGCTPKDDSNKPVTGCNLAGTYRLRFDARVGQWLWFRFELDKSMKAKLVAPKAIEAKELKIDPDPAACKLAVIAKTERGDLLASLTVDKKTNAVTGTLRGVGMREGISITGVRDVGPIPPSEVCVRSGIYTLVIPSEQEWKSAEGRSCDTAIVRVPFLVEYVGDKLVLDQLDADGNAAWAAEDVYVLDTDPCSIEVRFRHDDWYTYATITFAGDKVTATGSSASVSVSGGGDVWRCEIKNPMAWIEKS